MPSSWDFSDGGVGFDLGGFTFDGGIPTTDHGTPIPPPTPITPAATLSDLFHFWGNDLTVSASGDVLAVQGTQRGQQRVLRRLLTIPASADGPAGYIFHPEYGAGLPRFIGQPIDPQKIAAAILSQMVLEDSVAQSPAPTVEVNQAAPDNTAFSVNIAYNDAATNKPVTLSFTVGA